MIPYIGGKSFLASWIISNFPAGYQSKTYCEVFGGGGWVLFRKDPSFIEIYNDLNKDMVNLFRQIRDNYPEFSRPNGHCTVGNYIRRCVRSYRAMRICQK